MSDNTNQMNQMNAEWFNKLEGVKFPFQTKFNFPIDFTKFNSRSIACPHCKGLMVYNKYTIGEFKDFYIINCYGLCPSCNNVAELPQLKLTKTNSYVFIKEKNAWMTKSELQNLIDQDQPFKNTISLLQIVALLISLAFYLFYFLLYK